MFERRKANSLKSKLLKAAKSKEVEPMFCGSIAKDTWLSGHKDIDLFLLFDENVDRKDLETKGLELAKSIIEKSGGKWKVEFSEHPYVKGEVDGHKIDIVPAYKVRDPSKIKSAVDRTPHHVKYIEKRMSKDLTSQVRILKTFCKGSGLYGSDMKTEGFSGYLCELLTLKYGSFENLVKEAAKWEAGTFIDIESHHSTHTSISRFDHPLVVVDPVDKNRNVAAVLSPDKFFTFKQKAERFLENPSLSFFYPPERTPMSKEELRRITQKRGTRLITLMFDMPEGHEDTSWTQIKKFTKRIEGILKTNEFEVLRTDAWGNGNKCAIILEMLVDTLPKIQKRLGPSVMDNRNSDSFRKRYAGHQIFIEDGKWAVEFFRPFTNVLELLISTLNHDESSLKKMGIPSHVASAIHKDLEILTDENLLDLAEDNSEFALFLTDYLKKSL